jgi:hypothetical protein
MNFQGFPKIARLSRECIVTEKIDGTNAQIFINEQGDFFTGSRKRWITPEDDNFGFSKWAYENKKELLKLGPGQHFGEWWGRGIRRGYGLNEKKFSLFNTSRWEIERPECCDIVPIIYKGEFLTEEIFLAIEKLKNNGSLASPGFKNPEGIVIFHTAANIMFKKTIIKDEKHKFEV